MENKEDDLQPIDQIFDDLYREKDVSKEEFLFLKDNLSAISIRVIPYNFPIDQYNQALIELKETFNCEFDKIGLYINTPFDYEHIKKVCEKAKINELIFQMRGFSEDLDFMLVVKHNWQPYAYHESDARKLFGFNFHEGRGFPKRR